MFLKLENSLVNLELVTSIEYNDTGAFDIRFNNKDNLAIYLSASEMEKIQKTSLAEFLKQSKIEI